MMSFKELLKNVENEYVADAPFLFMRRQEFTSVLSKIKLFDLICTIPGHIIECGVRTGNSLMLWNLLSSVIEPFNVGRRIVGFDTFEGFPKVSKFDGDWKEGYLGDVNYELLKQSGILHQNNSATPIIERLQIFKGDSLVEIPKYLISERETLAISLLYLDFDLYEPTLRALECLYSFVVPGGVIVFDELFQKKFPGETKAFNEFFKVKPELKKFKHDPHLTYFIKN